MKHLIFLIIYLQLNHYGTVPIVDTNLGKISGKLLRTFMYNVEYYGFMGIPFASPPVGELRFLSPTPPEPWEGILKADEEKPACIQYNYNIPKQQPHGVYGAEDCLFLDVFTPKLPEISEDKLPVIVFLYNEQFRNSYNKSVHYGPDFFIEENVIVVTISHRLGVFGFLSFEDDLLPGNAGLKDIVLALEWVNDNIKYFGGDDGRITLMGVQGGGAAVDMLLHSSKNNLFHAAIIQSGTSWSSQYFQKNVRKRALKLAELLNRSSSNSKQIIKELNDVSAHDLLLKEWNANPEDYFLEHQRNLLTFGPVVEKSSSGLITKYPEDTNISINIPIMIGFNSREGIEGALQYLIEPRYLRFVEKSFAINMPKRVKFRFDPESNAYQEAAQEIKDFYFSGKVDLNHTGQFITYIGDVSNMYAIDNSVKIYSNVSAKPIFYYNFDYSSSLNENKMNLYELMTVRDGIWGAATGDEMCYLFKCPALLKEYRKYNESNHEAIKIQREMVRMWTNFAKFKSPTKEDGTTKVNWKPYTLKETEYLSIGKEIKMKKNLCSGRFKFWEEFINKWGNKAIKRIISDIKRNEL